MYLSNEGPGGEAYFDDFTIQLSESNIVQTIDYYPYGMVAESWSRQVEEGTFELFQEGRALRNSPVDCFTE